MRIQALDKARGVVLIIMAIDHAKEMIGKNIKFSGEFWNRNFPFYEDSFLFFTRLITHICAPSFAFMMGLSMILLTHSNKTKWQDEVKLWKYFCLRGFILILFEYLIFAPIWSFVFKDPSIVFRFAVISMLGSLMILISFLVKRHWSIQVIVMLLSIFIPPFFFSTGELDAKNINFLLNILFVPDGNYFIYAIFPYIGIGILGLLFGKILIKKEKIAFTLLPILGIIFISLFIFSRLIGSVYFNLKSLVSLSDSHWWSFFYMIKYPPSLTYLLFTLGIFFILFSLIYFIDKFTTNKIIIVSKFLDVANVYGKSTFFFYAMHLIILCLLGVLILDILKWSSISDIAYGWIIALIILYPLCKWYRDFKKKKNENSLWRML
ncbi:heparan-alpha-glucosaminide N-acetyltransferase domain-containing protein [Fluviispira vulneris]|uniref:heparan-alpha-glucosaminide N-acetyltransferase domain-containing protein n=1 Tax=Fluviispira vulneris TaxID=2763012 RepID=UPI0016464FA3|nr:heparan-alpha-glucosaminide N-acetyltransferase domain-containing protein [Fluviispira vulneris]